LCHIFLGLPTPSLPVREGRKKKAGGPPAVASYLEMSTYNKVDSTGYIDEPLLALESSPMMLYGAGITTMNFFEGNLEDAKKEMRERLVVVGNLNRWIGCGQFEPLDWFSPCERQSQAW
jgi:hypothetical protein